MKRDGHWTSKGPRLILSSVCCVTGPLTPIRDSLFSCQEITTNDEYAVQSNDGQTARKAGPRNNDIYNIAI